jgi:hypothetical protein
MRALSLADCATMTTPPDGPDQPGQYPAGGYTQGPPPGYGYAAPDHPKAVTALILGTLGLITCQVMSPFAWAIGKKAVAEIDASGGRIGGRGQAQAGYILGVIGSVVLGLAVLFLLGMLLLLLVFGVAGVAQTGI